MSQPSDNTQPDGVPNPSPGGFNTFPIPPTNQGMPPRAPFGSIPPPVVGGQQFNTPASLPGLYYLPPLSLPLCRTFQDILSIAPFILANFMAFPFLWELDLPLFYFLCSFLLPLLLFSTLPLLSLQP